MTTSMTRRDLEAKIIANAWRDPAYRKRLEADPKAVVSEELKKVDPSIELPDSLKVNVHQEDADTFHLVLPRDPRDLKVVDVVPDHQLEAIAPQTVAVAVLTGPVPPQVVVTAIVVGPAIGVGGTTPAIAAVNVAATGVAIA
ncbi:MAG: NHLP leader peptide family RiPP precursor [Pseudomonadota bacterium]